MNLVNIMVSNHLHVHLTYIEKAASIEVRRTEIWAWPLPGATLAGATRPWENFNCKILARHSLGSTEHLKEFTQGAILGQ